MNVVKGNFGFTKNEVETHYKTVVTSLKKNGWSGNKKDNRLTKGNIEVVFDHLETHEGQHRYDAEFYIDGRFDGAVFCMKHHPSFTPEKVADRINNY